MIDLYPEEKILHVIHRHWMAITVRMTILILLCVVPLFGFIIMRQFSIPETITALVIYAFTLYALLLTVIAFNVWMDYYLDIWVVTTRRVIDIEHKGVFNREVSEFLIEQVQDVTTQNRGILSIFFGYGIIQVHTAGETTFTAHDLPNVKEIKNIIISLRMKGHERALQMGSDQAQKSGN